MPNGIPIMVQQRAKPDAKYSSAVASPPNSSHNRLPIHPMVYRFNCDYSEDEYKVQSISIRVPPSWPVEILPAEAYAALPLSFPKIHGYPPSHPDADRSLFPVPWHSSSSNSCPSYWNWVTGTGVPSIHRRSSPSLPVVPVGLPPAATRLSPHIRHISPWILYRWHDGIGVPISVCHQLSRLSH